MSFGDGPARPPLTAREARHWLRQARRALEWGRLRGLSFPWAAEVEQLCIEWLRARRRHRRVASLGLRATVVEKGRFPVGTPETVSIGLDKDVLFNTAPKDADGNPVTGATVTWASSDPAVMTVHESNNLFLPQFPPTQAALGQSVALGTAVITATCGEASDSITVTVAEAPPPTPVATLNLTATVVDKQ